MNWWDMLKNIQNPPQGMPQKDWYDTQQSPPQPRTKLNRTVSGDVNVPQTTEQIEQQGDNPPNLQIGENRPNVQPTTQATNYMQFHEEIPEVSQNPQTQNIDTSSGADSGADDSDVGEISENVSRVKENLTQQPRGPKAKEITSILTDLSAAAIDPVNQKNIVVQAKKDLQAAFPQVA